MPCRFRRTLINHGFEVDIAANGLIAKEKVDMHNEYEFYIFDHWLSKIIGLCDFDGFFMRKK